MKITWYGHSCFRLESAAGSVIFDPYERGSVPGMELPVGFQMTAPHFREDLLLKTGFALGK